MSAPLTMSTKIGNVMGVPLPFPVRAQLQTRSAMNSHITETELEGAYNFNRPTDNIKYLENKTGWVRLVSSIDVGGESLQYFQKLLPDGQTLKDASDLAKRFVLYSGTSIYQKVGDSFQYGFREGVSNDGLGAYGNFGSKDEVSKYGYRPMPGIVDVKIQTQGRLGSVRQATVNFKVWTKDQLDIMDALYFKMGYMMFLEWGHVFYYDNEGKFQQMGVTIDPFEPGLTKEAVNLKIAELKEKTDGNYDAMLGMCTSFNFDFNQEGGYDCTIKLIGLGALADSTKVNLSSTIPDFTKEQIEQFYNLLRKYKEIQLRKEQAAEAAKTPAPAPPVVPPTANEFITKYFGIPETDVLKYTTGTSVNTQAQINAKTHGVVVKKGSFSGVLYRDKGIFLPEGSNSANEKYFESITKDGQRIKAYADIISNPTGQTKVERPDEERNFASVQYTYNTSRIKYTLDARPGGVKSSITAESFIKGGPGNNNYYFVITIQIPDYLMFWESVGSVSAGYTGGYGYGGGGSNATHYLNFAPVYDTDGSKKAPARIETGFTKISTEVAAWFYAILKTVLKDFSTGADRTGGIETVVFERNDAPYTSINNNLYFTNQAGFGYYFKSNTIVKQKADVYQEDPIDKTKPKILTTGLSDIKVYYDSFDASIIKDITVKDESIVLKEYKDRVGAAANAAAAAEAQRAAAEAEKQFQAQVAEAVKEEGVNYNSGLETFLRAIQLHSLNKAVTTIEGSASSPNFDFREVGVINLLEGAQNNSIIEQLFVNTIFKGQPRKFVDNINQFSAGLEKSANKRDRFLAFTAYGYNHNLMSSSDPKAFVEEKKLKTCDFKGMFNSWVMPYDINTEVMKGVDINHPVYIRLDLLILVLNQMCLLYDTPKSDDTTTGEKAPALENQTPLVYIDFNTYTNTCLSTPLQMSIDITKFMIQFRGTNEQYRRLFVIESVDENDASKVEIDKLKQQGKSDADILAIIGNSIKETEKKDLAKGLDLFKPEQNDFISRALPEFKDPTNASTGAWQGRVMNVLVNVDYLLSLCKSLSSDDNSHGVYLRPFLQQILDDLNKSLGDINLFRLAYDDKSNCLYIVDDQSSPHQPGEDYSRMYNIAMESYMHVNLNRNSIELPLYGRDSIAKSLSIKTEVSSKLSNMLAISANSNKKTDAGKDATPFGQYNKDFINRYMNQALTVDTGETKVTEGEKKAAETFNEFVKSIFQTDQPQLDNIDQALNYYIERMNDKKSERSATRASAMIPVSVNFTTDGISGLAMGHAFTIPQELLPRTYERFTEATGKRVGFVVVGLDHSIGGNVWDTSVRANMFFIKDAQDYYTSSKLFKMDPLAQGKVEGRGNIGQITTPTTRVNQGGGGTAGCEKLKLTTAEEASAAYPRSTKWQRGSSPVIVNPTNPPGYSVNLNALPIVEFTRTIVTPQEYISAAEKIINSLAPAASNSNKKQILISAYAIARAEQGGPNGGFKGFNNNISGIESSGFKVYAASDVVGRVGATEGGTGKKKFYYAFSTLSAGLVPPISKVMERNMFSPSGDPEEWAWRWYRDWNGYGARDKGTSDCQNINSAKSAYNSAKSFVDRFTTYT